MYYLGIDIGSTTSKAVVINEKGEIVAKEIVIAGIGTDGSRQVYEKILEQVPAEQIARVTSTGYGRKLFEAANAEISELSCHAKGVFHTFPQTRTIIDIGGQDAKVLLLNDKGRMVNFVMNDKCAAGTGRFLDVMANILHLQIGDLQEEYFKSKQPINISNTCTVFAESEVISQLAAGQEKADVIAGICISVANRVASLAKRVGIKEKVCMSGGVARNQGVRDAMSKKLEMEILFSPDAQYMGALGAALYSLEEAQ